MSENIYVPFNRFICARQRYTQPALGNWITRDRLQYIDGPNLYQFVLSNPVLYVDPMGTVGGYTPPAKSPGNGTPCCITPVPFWQYYSYASYSDCVKSLNGIYGPGLIEI